MSPAVAALALLALAAPARAAPGTRVTVGQRAAGLIGQATHMAVEAADEVVNAPFYLRARVIARAERQASEAADRAAALAAGAVVDDSAGDATSSLSTVGSEEVSAAVSLSLLQRSLGSRDGAVRGSQSLAGSAPPRAANVLVLVDGADADEAAARARLALASQRLRAARAAAAPTPPLPPSMANVLALTALYLVAHAFAAAAKAVTPEPTDDRARASLPAFAALRDADRLTHAVALAPMLCVVYLACRLRAQALTLIGAPPAATQAWMAVGTAGTAVLFLNAVVMGGGTDGPTPDQVAAEAARGGPSSSHLIAPHPESTLGRQLTASQMSPGVGHQLRNRVLNSAAVRRLSQACRALGTLAAGLAGACVSLAVFSMRGEPGSAACPACDEAFTPPVPVMLQCAVLLGCLYFAIQVARAAVAVAADAETEEHARAIELAALNGHSDPLERRADDATLGSGERLARLKTGGAENNCGSRVTLRLRSLPLFHALQAVDDTLLFCPVAAATFVAVRFRAQVVEEAGAPPAFVLSAATAAAATLYVVVAVGVCSRVAHEVVTRRSRRIVDVSRLRQPASGSQAGGPSGTDMVDPVSSYCAVVGADDEASLRWQGSRQLVDKAVQAGKLPQTATLLMDLAMLAHYIFLFLVVLSLFTMGPPVSRPRLAPALQCLAALCLQFYVVSAGLYCANQYQALTGRPVVAGALLARARPSLQLIPLLCALFLQLRMRSVQLHPAGFAPGWAQVLMVATAVAVLVQMVLELAAGLFGGNNPWRKNKRVYLALLAGVNVAVATIYVGAIGSAVALVTMTAPGVQ